MAIYKGHVSDRRLREIQSVFKALGLETDAQRARFTKWARNDRPKFDLDVRFSDHTEILPDEEPGRHQDAELE